ncbi:MFS transporter [Alicyclobacillus acidoterrestris]|uniref:MFS transporter n=2 Tax=Alicyclobacillus acidoterrestris TaxID=1450 RepID=A0A9E6ZH81_ALIAG|nr:MFS transporter [Alicyclobacillus acidoterrestris]UNO50667.1 MFS transporter [Alicyclobacillus acidoterrestris]
MRAYVWMSCGMYFMNGLATAMLGTVLAPFLAHYHVSYALGGVFVLLQFAGYLLGVPASTIVVQRYGHRIAILLAGLCIGIAETTIGCLPLLPVALFMSCLNGVGLAMTQTTIASSMIEWFEGRRAVIMSRLEVAFGLGCLIIPLCESRLLAVHIWQVGFWIVGIFALLISLAWPFVSINPESNANEGPMDAYTRAPKVTSTQSKVVFMALFLFMILLYVGLESCFNNFLPAIFMSYLGQRADVASLTVTAFWTSMVVGRTLTGWAIRKVNYSQFLLSSIGATLLFVMVMASWRSISLFYVISCFIGLSMSGIYVVTLVYANHTFPGQGSRVTRWVTVFAGVGGAALPGIFGYCMDQLSVDQNLWLLAGFTFLLLATLSVIVYLGSAWTHKVSS